jgi:hypothetical protein
MAVIKFIEISRELNITENKDYKLREVYINPEHVVFMREDHNTLRLLQEQQLPDDLDQRQRFTRIILNKGTNGQELVVVGNPEMTEQKLFSNKQLLRG